MSDLRCRFCGRTETKEEKKKNWKIQDVNDDISWGVCPECRKEYEKKYPFLVGGGAFD